VSAALANRVSESEKATYLNAALEAWQWFRDSGMINSDNLINDGLNSETCENNGEPTWSYNQGVILGALAELYRATDDSSYLDAAEAIANAVTTPGSTMLDSNGVLVDGCDRDHNCTGDALQFKGIFTRNLRMLQSVRPSTQWHDFLETNAQAIWNNDREVVDGNCFHGVYWIGPYTTADGSSQSSAQDAFNAALSVTS
jgi:predicted alpha-1,6-mannanase (GH76 family)